MCDVPHVDAVSLCVMCPVSQGSGGGVFANDNEEQRAIEHRSIEQRSKPEIKITMDILIALIMPLMIARANTNYFHVVREILFVVYIVSSNI